MVPLANSYALLTERSNSCKQIEHFDKAKQQLTNIKKRKEKQIPTDKEPAKKTSSILISQQFQLNLKYGSDCINNSNQIIKVKPENQNNQINEPNHP